MDILRIVVCPSFCYNFQGSMANIYLDHFYFDMFQVNNSNILFVHFSFGMFQEDILNILNGHCCFDRFPENIQDTPLDLLYSGMFLVDSLNIEFVQHVFGKFQEGI